MGMLAHAASAHGISAIENICGRDHEVNHNAIPAACFTHPEIAMVGPTEEQAKDMAEEHGWVIGIHAADLIQECANAVAAGTTVQELSMMVHTHPTLSEVMDEAFKGAVGMS